MKAARRALGRTPKKSLSLHREAVNRAVRGLKAANARAASLSREEIEIRMISVINERVGEAGTVSKQDFLRAGVPPSAIEANFKRLLARARIDDPTLGKLEGIA